ncbi:MAG: glycoside hydrolase family 88 protein [Lachnospiraceae bacterium]|nr:glycoside hydrolase family 88 protein [Lachnospiraceae bacterium]
MNQETIEKALRQYASSFEKVLYEEDTKFLEGMKDRNLAGDDIRRYQFWEWTQGVGLFGFWKMFQSLKDERYLEILKNYYERQFKIGLPAKNVNTVTPMLALSYLAEYLQNEAYMDVCREWAQWIVEEFPRTKEGGFQHITSDTLNEGELWDDTLFMTVLFLANMGRILNNEQYKEEAKYQFLLHTKYLADKKTGLWYHGWTFLENHNFAGAFWGRGNCWITVAIPEFLKICECEGCVKRFLAEALKRQAESLKKYQAEDGMWHTLVDDPDSYVEASATCGFACGLLMGVHTGLLDQEYEEVAMKPLQAILDYTDEEGILHQVSYGTPMGRKEKQFYKEIELKPMPYGQALAMLYLLEIKESN